MGRIEIMLAHDKEDLKGILALQKINLPAMLSKKDQQTQGFVSIRHEFDLLFRMNTESRHAIAKYHGEVIGYALAMSKEFQDDIPMLRPMFKRVNDLEFNEQSLDSVNYLIMGQVCIAKDYRGIGLFGSLFDLLRKEHSSSYKYLITEVAKRNTRSLRAHKKQGFSIIHEYDADEHWIILLWQW